MGEVIVVTQEELEESLRKLEELLADDTHWEEEQEQFNRYEAEERKRLDEEYAARQLRGKDSNEEAE